MLEGYNKYANAVEGTQPDIMMSVDHNTRQERDSFIRPVANLLCRVVLQLSRKAGLVQE